METHQQTVIRLLTLLAETEGPVSSDETWILSDLDRLAELAEGGFISVGEIVSNQSGPCAIVFMRINPSGRAFLADMQEKAARDTSIGIIKKHRFAFYKWFFAAVTTILTGYILWRLTH